MPTDLRTRPELAVKSLPGWAKLATSSPPVPKSAAPNGTAEGSPYGELVIWQSTQSPRPASARQTARRPQLGLRQLREGERDQHYFAG
jgi:hypothetical protein